MDVLLRSSLWTLEIRTGRGGHGSEEIVQRLMEERVGVGYWC